MGVLTKDAILGADDIKRQLVEVPEWGGSCYVSVMNGKSRDAFESEMAGARNSAKRLGRSVEEVLTNFRASLVVRCLVDESGKRLFADSDVELVGAKSGAALDRVFEVALKLNKLSNADVENLTKN